MTNERPVDTLEEEWRITSAWENRVQIVRGDLVSIVSSFCQLRLQKKERMHMDNIIDSIIQSAFLMKKQQLKQNGMRGSQLEYQMEKFRVEVYDRGLLIVLSKDLSVNRIHTNIFNITTFCKRKNIDITYCLYYRENKIVKIS